MENESGWEVDVVLQFYQEGCLIEVGPDPDGFGLVEFRVGTLHEKGVAWDQRFAVAPEILKEVADRLDLLFPVEEEEEEAENAEG